MADKKDKPILKLPLKTLSTHMHIDALDHALSTAISELTESERRGLKAATEEKRKGGKVKKKKKKKSKSKTKKIMYGYKAGGKV
tara:strand:+ start:262 stop:513 length:252 start_codon:yes stop_codon:yes gene_type:complete